MVSQPAELTVGQLSTRSGAAVSTLHFYESKGLIRSNRTAVNQRRYAGDVLLRVAVMLIGHEVGIPKRGLEAGQRRR